MSFLAVEAAIFGAWLLVWLLMALGARSGRSEPSWSRVIHLGLMGVAAALVFLVRTGPLARTLWPSLPEIGVALTVLGCAFALWARRTLGASWNGRVTIQEGHELVTHGPYRLARHPIYTGLLTATAGVATGDGSLAALLGVLVLAGAIARKILLEEAGLLAHFGASYERYRSEVHALIPFIL